MWRCFIVHCLQGKNMMNGDVFIEKKYKSLLVQDLLFLLHLKTSESLLLMRNMKQHINKKISRDIIHVTLLVTGDSITIVRLVQDVQHRHWTHLPGREEEFIN